jgi:Domain of unknown function (DUF927)
LSAGCAAYRRPIRELPWTGEARRPCSAAAALTTALLHDDPNVLISRLANLGMKIKCTTSARSAFAEYLASINANERVTVARHIGWIEIGVQRAFVLPGEIIGDNLGERVILVKEAGAPYGRRGTLDNWREAIAAPASDHRMLRFVIATPEFWGEVQPPASLKGLDIPSRRAVFVPWKPSRRRAFGMGNPTFS